MLHSQHIFLADDDSDDVEIFQYALEGVGSQCTLTVAINGIELLDGLLSAPVLPDLLFIDINMPIMNGLQALAEIKKTDKLKHIPVILYSTSKAGADRAKAIAAGADYYLPKPTDPAKLTQELKQLLKRDWRQQLSSVENVNTSQNGSYTK